MALVLTRSVMLLAPKTGSTWAHKALFEQGQVRAVLWSADNYPHPGAAMVRGLLGDVFVFCFVRHPVAWLRSYWAASFLSNGKGVDFARFGRSPWAEFAECESPSFLHFATRYLERCPGAVGRLFERYTDGADFVGRHESILPDLGRALELAGETIDMEQLAAVPRENQSSAFPLGELAEAPESILRAIEAAERPFLSAHYPDVAARL